MRVPSGQVHSTRPSTSHLFLAAKAEGGRRNRAVCGRETGEVEAGLVRLGGGGRGQGRL
jgi:hypothetical protein